MELTQIGDYKIRLSSIDSTNSYAASMFTLGKPAEGTVVLAEYQEKGRGQLNASWESEKGKNILASFILYPRIDLSDFFCLNQCVAIAVRTAVARFLPGRNVTVKWPNDILVDEKKIAGILIENSIRGSQFAYSIAGIAINVNQRVFSRYSPEATSLSAELSVDLPLSGVLNALCQSMNEWYTILKLEDMNRIRAEYQSAFFGIRQKRKFTGAAGSLEAVIQGVANDGKLILALDDGSTFNAGFKELGFVF